MITPARILGQATLQRPSQARRRTGRKLFLVGVDIQDRGQHVGGRGAGEQGPARQTLPQYTAEGPDVAALVV